MPINAFLFDLDGTLVDSIPDLTRAVNLLRNELGLADISSDQVRTYVGDGVGLLLQRALPEDLFSANQRTRFMEIYTVLRGPPVITSLVYNNTRPIATTFSYFQVLFML